ncbi:hypothetical protein CDO44_14270 [Pigmentiphaga sp. NML080357]|uniref:helix-turn-helix transcriptional regulator n=1 Tax=Pigmentiphaga sp. NML080357 TaxID=2008675 RepID=UPI000B4070F4|nr:AraC family transcriptional regulator [Pigmentiphaga sp. NML080357]OVZ58855.1 hypothetical protein CDO44_14270 [Pigmentiphaga sp. NML080357]
MTVPPSEQWHLSTVTASLSISGGVLHTTRDEAVMEQNEAGLKLVLLLGGALRYSMQRHRQVGIAGPAVHLSLSRSPFMVSHCFHAASPLRYVAVRMPEAALHDELDIDLGLLGRRAGVSADTPFFLDRQANKILQTLGRQLLLCPLQGSLRKLYVAGKALELTSTVLAGLELAPGGGARAGVLALSPRQLESLHQARALLLDQLSSPPGLAALARQVGLNVTTLTRGFRELFGCSVYHFVRDQRLELAYRMLAAGACTVAQAASASGYSDSHFSKAFQKRFGIAPRTLRR